jgi:hypothetical protein
MNWIEILKADPCTLEAKERLYRVLEKMGANNDLLHSFKDLDSDELRGMIEEFSTTAMESQRPMFKQMLRDWDMCLVQSHRNPNAPPISSEHSQESMMYKRAGGKSKKIQGREFKQALEDTISIYMNDLGIFELLPQGQFWDTLREKYAENLSKDTGENAIALRNITNHIKAKMSSKSLLNGGMIHRYLRSLGYETPPYPPSKKEAMGLTQSEWKNRFWGRP